MCRRRAVEARRLVGLRAASLMRCGDDVVELPMGWTLWSRLPWRMRHGRSTTATRARDNRGQGLRRSYLQGLVRSGYAYEVEGLVAWAIADGWYPAEIPRLRDYARRVLDGGRFRLGDPRGPQKGASKHAPPRPRHRHRARNVGRPSCLTAWARGPRRGSGCRAGAAIPTA